MGARLQHLINHVRVTTENEVPTSTDSITDQEIIFMFNEGLDRIWSKIAATRPDIFISEEIVDIVSNQETYTIPARAFTDNRIHSVEYSDSNDEYYMLDKASYKLRDSKSNGVPNRYFRKNNKIYINPIPAIAGGKLKISYVRRPNDMDIKRGTVGAVTVAGGAITSLGFTAVSAVVTADLTANYDYLSIVDFYGNVKVAAIPFTAIGATVTIATGSHVLQSGESVASGDIIVGGKYASTHSELPETCDRYLSQFAIYKLFKRDSSEDAGPALQELAMIEEDIIESFQDQDDDVKFVPIIGHYEVF